MSETENEPLATDTQSGADDGRELHDLVLNLNFVPTWARESSTKNPYADGNLAVPRDDRRDRGPRIPDNRQGGQRRNKDARRGPRDQGPRGRPQERAAAPDQEYRRDYRSDRGEQRLPIEVSFIPERNRLGAVVRQLHHAQRAYPIMFVAGLFLSHAEHHMLKLEIHGGDARNPMRLFQCGGCQAVFLDRETLQSHALKQHLAQVFEVQELTIEPPAGNFVCVARCRLSGELLGPPNYHGYNERVQELRRERFPHLSMDEYRKNIEQLHDPALIEKWKDAQKTQRVYKLKSDPNAAGLKRAEAETQFLEQHFAKMIHAGQRFIAPATMLRNVEDPRLTRLVHDAWVRENRFPLRLSLALRPAFRRMRLYLFKAGRETFVTAIQPKPLDATHVVDDIRHILQFLHDNPGITRQQLLEKLHPGAAPDSPEAAKALGPLRWLIEKGHVIEFFNGTLSVPGGARMTQAGAGATDSGTVAV